MTVIQILQQDGVIKWLGIISSILTILSFIGGFITAKKIENTKINNKIVKFFFSNNNDVKQVK